MVISNVFSQPDKKARVDTTLNTRRMIEIYTQKGPIMRPLCKICNSRPVAVNYHKEGTVFYRSKCDHCSRNRKPGIPAWHKAGYRMKCKCDRCGFTSKYPQQFNVYYIDGSPANCNITNLKTVCANCQRILHILKLTWKQGDLIPDLK